MKVYSAPHPIHDMEGATIFLAGSIEMGKATCWQSTVIGALATRPLTILNPRRANWDASWKQDASDTCFHEQVTWELSGIESSDIVAFYFDPETKSPISLLEFGLAIGLRKKILVACPHGFWRKGNIDVTAARNAITVLPSLEALIGALQSLTTTHKESS